MTWFKSKEQRLGESLSEERLYALVAKEIAGSDIRPGMWLKAVAQAGGDEASARAAYVRLRVQQIQLGIGILAEYVHRIQPPAPESPPTTSAPTRELPAPERKATPSLREQVASIYAGRASCMYCRTKNIRPAGTFTERGATRLHECITCLRFISGEELLITEQAARTN